ncbi:MAG: 3-hydroxyacyl-ACP dehydratase FabZ [Deferribacterales bacterium]|jgi:beta-hydroxyacyl-ACP dehydratase FabZ|uniref:3-hydroxyacyl-ACP dehydratase FabZ n=1 Tax=Deferrivibrio essentukiensis TaxID=2880922 RepID=UPI00199955D5|nr:3-hydroxyacyl-ACP dehydratase FabZ [Deferrivibrio essentukiensis]MBC7195705.1 3-hydroxyacyl-ACP dehydratase FabZ [Deferribacterales bacterium]MBZ4672342.1 (3R)-hydroxymyristoyl-(acyl-carrier-protein)dehydratase [Deferribacteraceae bacterium]MCB4203728.1 3-hydroxyacyl-ACP dehydratase FabZ [Deferrivibrio essentukiensis]
MDIKTIMKNLPHRYPFLLVDKVVELNDTSIKAIKNVTINENFFMGHFPGEPVMPGVLIVEAMAQAGGLIALNEQSDKTHEDILVYFMAIDNVKFRRPVVPGDVLMLDVELVKKKRNIWRMKGVATVEGEVACEAEFMAMVKEK